MNLQRLKQIYADKGCQQVYVKSLSPNDNSKNQVYLGGSFDLLNIFPITQIVSDSSGDWDSERFKASLSFSWIDDQGQSYPAPKSQLILYPKYPEVRFSGFLARCQNAPSDLMTIRQQGRLLFLGVSINGNIIGYVSSPDSELANEFNSLTGLSQHGVFSIISLASSENDQEKLLSELKRICLLSWIKSKRLDKNGNIIDCTAPQCGGYTLEAELGIIPNGYSEPDYLGWEIKQFSVANFKRLESSTITLMTPEPTNGFYGESGVEAFTRKYGYPDKAGRPDRINFGGIHKVGFKHPTTQLKMVLDGFDSDSGKIRNASGKITLLDLNDNEAASWSFSSLILHWNRKHNRACYVPSLSTKAPSLQYRYGDRVILGVGTDFQLFLNQMALGNIYYDPGIKLENASTKGKTKARSQFRIKSKHIPSIYQSNSIVELL